MKKMYTLLVLMLLTSFTPLAWGADNYNDCILENMKNTGSDVAAKAILSACKAKHVTEGALTLKQSINFFKINSICVETEALNVNSVYFLPSTNELFTGFNYCEFLNGNVKSKGGIKDGKFDGKWTFWHDNGRKGLEKNYKNGKLNGKVIRWSYKLLKLEDQIKSEENWKDGEKDGKWSDWFDNGHKKSEEIWKFGVEDSEWTTWFDNGQIYLEKNYKDGKKDGKWTTWFDNGELYLEKNYKDGKKDGKWTTWSESGQIGSEGNWKNDKKEGKWTTWFDNGRVLSEKNYIEGKKDGKWTTWFENGQIFTEKQYKDGKCISEGC